jgi:hypothetical protein
MASCGIVSSSRFADAQIQVQQTRRFGTEPPSSGFWTNQVRKSSLTPSQLIRKHTPPCPVERNFRATPYALSRSEEVRTRAIDHPIRLAAAILDMTVLSCKEFERLGHELRVELEHRAVSGIGVDDEVAIRKTPRQIVRVLAWH